MTTATEYLAAARSELGYTESPKGSNCTKFAAEAGHAKCQPWCATFLVAIAKRTGLSLPSTSAYTPTMYNSFVEVGRAGKTPQVGAFVFFDFPDSKKRIQHVGVVAEVRDSVIVTIEGNTSDGPGGSQDNGGGVYQRVRSASQYVVGYGYPIYQEQPQPIEDEEMAIVLFDDISNPVPGSGQLFAPVGDAVVELPNGWEQVDQFRDQNGNGSIAVFDANHDDLAALLARGRK